MGASGRKASLRTRIDGNLIDGAGDEYLVDFLQEFDLDDVLDDLRDEGFPIPVDLTELSNDDGLAGVLIGAADCARVKGTVSDNRMYDHLASVVVGADDRGRVCPLAIENNFAAPNAYLWTDDGGVIAPAPFGGDNTFAIEVLP